MSRVIYQYPAMKPISTSKQQIPVDQDYQIAFEASIPMCLHIIDHVDSTNVTNMHIQPSETFPAGNTNQTSRIEYDPGREPRFVNRED